jgi:Txe/YoeB family toxin of toxin-antitoxin system
MYNYIETKLAIKDKKLIFKSYSISVRKKLEVLFNEIIERPKTGKGNPEQLKHTEKEMWSRELTKKDRIVYGIENGDEYGFENETIIVFYQYLEHYDDK